MARDFFDVDADHALLDDLRSERERFSAVGEQSHHSLVDLSRSQASMLSLRSAAACVQRIAAIGVTGNVANDGSTLTAPLIHQGVQ